MKELKKPFVLVIAILLADQILKIWVKLNFTLGEEVSLLGDWCKLHFIENEGMAFGMSFGGEVGKYLLTGFRIVASCLIGWYLVKLIKSKARTLTIYSFTLIFVGAVVNILDSLFYGLIFSESTFFSLAQAFPPEGGYAPLGLGKVVDMFCLPLIDTVLPDWLPIWGGTHFRFFNAIFNISDMAITMGVIVLLITLFVNDKKSSEVVAKQTKNDLSTGKNN